LTGEAEGMTISMYVISIAGITTWALPSTYPFTLHYNILAELFNPMNVYITVYIINTSNHIFLFLYLNV